MRVLVCGSRDYNNRLMVNTALHSLINTVTDGITIIEGGAAGADSFAKNVAIKNKLDLEEYPADWNKYGKRAGFVRNAQMLEEGKPDLVLAFYTDINNKSKGTKMMVDLATKAGVKVVEYGRED